MNIELPSNSVGWKSLTFFGFVQLMTFSLARTLANTFVILVLMFCIVNFIPFFAENTHLFERLSSIYLGG